MLKNSIVENLVAFFQVRRGNLNDYSCPGRPITVHTKENIYQVCTIINENHHASLDI